MIGHYFLAALRNLRGRPVNTAIKLLALSLGLTCLLAAHVIGDYFRQADRDWEKATRTYLVVQETERPGGGWDSSFQAASAPIAKYLLADFPELEIAARMLMASLPVRRQGVEAGSVAFPVDPEFLDVFDLEMTAGERSLERPRTVLINTTAAAALFGEQDPVGQSLLMGVTEVTVAGVYRDIPMDSHLAQAGRMYIPVLTSIEAWEDNQVATYPQFTRISEQDNFQTVAFVTYVVLPEEGSLTAADLQRRLADFAERRVPPGTLDVRFSLFPVGAMSELRFNQQVGTPFGASIVTALYLLGALTLAIGCVNFANLSAAEATMRAREIGLRKTVGATRRQVAAQMLVESGILAVAALLLAAPLVMVAMRVMTMQLFLPLALPGASRLDYWAGVAAIIIGVAVVAGVYPALVLANLRPVFAIRAARLRGGSGLVRALLIGAQFAAASFLLSLVAVMLIQQADLRRAALRPGEDPVAMIPLPAAQTAEAQEDRLNGVRQQLLASPAVTGVTFRTSTPFYELDGQSSEFAQSLDPGARRISGQARRIYYDYFETMGIEVIAGRAFSRDEDDTFSLLIDAATVREFGYSRPEEAIGQPIFRVAAQQNTAGADGNPPEFRIIGVVEREPLELTAQGPTNYLYVLQPVMGGAALVRLARDNVEGGLAHVRSVWEQFDQPQPPNPTFLDQAFEQNYRAYSMITTVFMALSAIAVVIAAMGLFGLASFVVQRRMREMGVRKTLGASASGVLALMLRDFSKPVIVANLVAWPAAFVAAQLYLNMFVTRIDLTPLPFLLALAGTLAVAWIAVAAHAVRAARVKPALVLKAE